MSAGSDFRVGLEIARDQVRSRVRESVRLYVGTARNFRRYARRFDCAYHRGMAAALMAVARHVKSNLGGF